MDISEKIINKLTKKAAAKQEVYRVCKSFFDMLKEGINELSEELSKNVLPLDKHVKIYIQMYIKNHINKSIFFPRFRPFRSYLPYRSPISTPKSA